MGGLKFADNYALDCIAKDCSTGKTLFSFKAREYTQKESGAGFVAGGIASGNQKYQIKTTDKRVKRLTPYAHTIAVDDIEYMLTFVKARRADLPFAYEWQRGKKEYVLELQ